MKKIILLFLCMVVLPALSRAQVAQMFATTNADGTVEYLMHHLKKNTITYFSSAKPSGIVLEIKKEMGSQYLVSFPNSADIYELEITSDAYTTHIQCKNPDGSVQTFEKVTYMPCYQYGQGDAQETIFVAKASLMSAYVYYSKRFPTGVLLRIMSGDMMIHIFKVSFPNSSQVYELDEKDESVLKCKNPDGSVQVFRLTQ